MLDNPNAAQEEDKVIYSFQVLWSGWEMDNTAWIMERADGSRYLSMTSHGSKYIADKSEIEERIVEYKAVLKQSEYALELLGQKN